MNNHQAGQKQSSHVESNSSTGSNAGSVHFANVVTSGNTDSNASVTMSREEYKSAQKQTGQLPQTSNKNESVLTIIGLALVASTTSLFGLKKRHN